MRTLVLLPAALLGLASASWAGESRRAPQPVAEQARLVWLSFGDGDAPAPEAGKEARRALDAFAASLTPEERATSRLHADPVDVLLAKAAWAGGDHAAARSRAQAALDGSSARPQDGDSGHILHEMHILLGRVALEQGDLEQAEVHLLRAARARGSPRMDAFGPDWTLARDLLARGRREVVSAYLVRVGAFWEAGRGILPAWKRMLAAGETPPFVRDPAASREPPELRLEIFGEPPPQAAPTGLLGFWESTGPTQHGIGLVLEFREGGVLLQHMIVLLDGRYRVDGAQLILTQAEDSKPTTMPVGSFGDGTWKVTAEGETVVKRRIGTVTPGAHPIVGTWTYDHYVGLGAKAFERYGADGWMRFRMPMPHGPTKGTWTQDGTTLRTTVEGHTESGTFTITGDRLRQTVEDDVNEYRYVGLTPWYVPAKPIR